MLSGSWLTMTDMGELFLITNHHLEISQWVVIAGCKRAGRSFFLNEETCNFIERVSY